jgi:cobalt-precorrin 5A hydrolase
MTAVVTLSEDGARIGTFLRESIESVDLYVHKQVNAPTNSRTFSSIIRLTAELFNSYRGIVYIAPCGVAVRAIAPCIDKKTVDPAVVCVDVCGRYAISLLSGHEGGANDLAILISNLLGAEPVITTTTEARKNVILGIGCRKNVKASEIISAITSAISEAGVELNQVRLLASADIKMTEEGLIQAAAALGLNLVFIISEEIRKSAREFNKSLFVQENVGLPAVAEPCALLAGRRTTLILGKKVFNGVTVAVAKENCTL